MEFNSKTIYKWKWDNGDVYYKSERRKGKKITSIEYDSTINAINLSLDETTNIRDDVSDDVSDNVSKNENKREQLDYKINGREMLGQRGTNPFIGQTSYLNDVVIRDMYLKPLNTTQGCMKHNNE